MRLGSAVAFAAILCISTAVRAEEKKCPISGHAAKDDVFLEVNGKTVNFCCKDCIADYKKQINLATEVNEKCPASGKASTEKQSVIAKTAEVVAFCCSKCAKGFNEKNKFEAKDEGPKKCPISGKDAKAGANLTVNGKKVYFCCADCVKEYKKQLGLVDKPLGNCPTSGKPAVEETAEIVVKSKEIRFCCPNCKKDYIEKHFKEGKVVADAKKE